MNHQEIYKHLWRVDDDFAQSILDDPLILPFLRVWALIKLGKMAEAKRLFDSQEYDANDPFEEMLHQELRLYYDFGHLKTSDLKQQASFIVESFPMSIYAKLELAGMERQYARAIELYTAVLEAVPSNPNALAGFIKSNILLRNREKALSVLENIKRGSLFDGLCSSKRRYWRVIFMVYEIALGKMTRFHLLANLIALIAGFFPQATWIFLLVMFIIGFLFGLFFLAKDELVATVLFLLTLSIVSAWLLGWGARALFFKLEG